MRFTRVRAGGRADPSASVGMTVFAGVRWVRASLDCHTSRRSNRREDGAPAACAKYRDFHSTVAQNDGLNVILSEDGTPVVLHTSELHVCREGNLRSRFYRDEIQSLQRSAILKTPLSLRNGDSKPCPRRGHPSKENIEDDGSYQEDIDPGNCGSAGDAEL
jgi:hypothetical protein